MTLTEFFDNIYRPLRLRGRAVNTTRLYHSTIKAFGRFLKREPMLADVADELTLARYLEERSKTHSPYTSEKERTQLMAMARLANERRMIPSLPTCPPGVLPDRVPTSWTVEELQRVFAQAGSLRTLVGQIPAAQWFQAILMVCWETGERIGALLDATPADYRRPDLVIRAESRKGRRRARAYSLSDATCDRLDELINHGGDRLFVWPYSRTYLWDMLKGKILQPAGLAAKRIGFHQVRRSAISWIAAAGGDPVAFAGHASPSTTKRWYLDPRMGPQGPKPHELLPRVDQPHSVALPTPDSQGAQSAELDAPPDRPAA